MSTFADHLRGLPDDGLAALLRLRPDLVVPVPADVSALAVRAQSRVSMARALDGLDQFSLEVLDALRLTRDPQDGSTSVDAVLAMTVQAPEASGPDVPDQTKIRATMIKDVIGRLRALALVYGPEHALHVVPSVDEVCSPYPAGLGRPAEQLEERAAALCADPARLRRTLLAAPPAARAVLDRLAVGPPVGTVAAGTLPASPDAGTDPAASSDSDSPVRWLVEHDLLVPISTPGSGRVGAATDRATNAYDTVELPREVGLLLRRDTGPLGQLHPAPPTLSAPHRDPDAADRAGAGQAMELVRLTEALLEALAEEPAPMLRAGGLGIRELRRLARAAMLDEPMAALLLEIGYAAGLIGEAEAGAGATRLRSTAEGVTGKVGRVASSGTDVQFLPTAGYDIWRGTPIAQRWHLLAQTWLAMTRQAALIGQRDDRDRLVNALAPEAERGNAPAVRRSVLDALAEFEPGAAPPAEAVLALLSWRAPRRAKGREPASREALAEAALLGVTGLGALTSYGRMLVAEAAADVARGSADDDPLGVRAGTGDQARHSALPKLVAALDAMLPAPVEHLLVQADLTVVVPGPPEPALAAELAMIAEPESVGGATVYRVTTDSIRQALDTGYAAADLHAVFKRRSRTPVPQSLSYLIDDVARKHGGLRAGSAGAYLRTEDEALLAEVLADRRLALLGLRRLAPTVLITPFMSSRLVNALRDAGYAPVPEDASGAAVLTRPKSRRAPTRTSVVHRIDDPLATPRLSGPRLLGIVEQIRRGDAAARAARRAPVTIRAANGHSVSSLTAVQAHTQALAVLQQAIRDKALVWVGYVDAHGATASRLVRPISIGAGYLRAEDERTEMLHTFALHRITAAVLEE